jgi:opacity protein-like surface antigen
LRINLHKHLRCSVKHLARVCALVVSVCGILVVPASAFAQTDKWAVDVAPLYFWVATTDGNIAINGTRDIPVYMDFADAKSKLAGAFSFHGEARRGRWGVVGDINFIRLSTDTSYTTPILSAPIVGTFQFDQIIFNGKATFEVKPGSKFHIVGGIRTLTMSPNVHFTGPVGGQLADIDISKTNLAGVAGFIYRPRLGNKVVLLTQADIGGGSAFTWSAGGGVEFIVKPWMGLAVGYNALHIDTGNVPTSGSGPVNDVQYAVTQYGPAFSMTLHWSGK